MFDSHQLFKERFSNHLKEMNRYLRYIFNGHIAVAMFFLISALAVFYQQWLAQLPENYPVDWIMGISLGLLVSYTPVQTLLKEPDLVFLIAAERKMTAYFRNTLLYSFIIQLYIVLIVVAAFGPLYFHVYTERSGRMYLLTIFIVLLFKGANLIVNWWMLKVRDQTIRHTDLIVRMVLNMAIFFFVIQGNIWFVILITLLFIGLFFYDLSVSQKQTGVAWELLVEKDRNRMQTFYRIANMFTDVPHLRNRVKKRSLLVRIVSNVPFLKKHTFDYLYRITFIRSGDYLGMYLRLLIIGGLFIYFVPNGWLKLIFAFLFLYLSVFQLIPLYHHYRTNMWLDIYPVSTRFQEKAVLKILYQLGFIQVVIYAVLFFIIQDYVGLLIIGVGGILFNWLFISGYALKKLK